MEELQRHLVRDHISDLRREADARRAAGMPARGDDAAEEAVGSTSHPQAPHRSVPVRVRFGHWLIGVGFSVAGADRDNFDRVTRHAA